MAAANSAVSFQGLSSGIQTDALINAILAQEGTRVKAMQARQEANKTKATNLTSMKSSLSNLMLSLSSLKDKLNARTVTSTDANGSYVTATATGASAGNHDVQVQTVATRGRLAPTLDAQGAPTNLAVAAPTDKIFTGDSATFAVQGTDGAIKTFTVTDNTLNGLKNAINAIDPNVTATIVNTGVAGKPYQLVVSAKDTGEGSTAGVVTLADLTANGPVNTLGISAGVVDDQSVPPKLTGLSSTTSGTVGVNARFTLDGIQLTRQSNIVKDAVDGMTFTLKQGGQTGTTTLTVAQDKTAATTAIQDVISKYNIVVNAYKQASTSTKNADGSINAGPLAGDAASRTVMTRLKGALMGNLEGGPADAAFKTLGSIGIRTQNDGTLTLNTTAFQSALDKDPQAVQRLFTLSGDSDNGGVSFVSASAKTKMGSVAFTISDIAADGTITGTLNGIQVTGSNGVLNGTGDLEGLSLAVTATGSGTLTLSRGVGQSVVDLITAMTSSGTGDIATALKSIDSQNQTLSRQIEQGQALLDRRKIALQTQFSKMEVQVAQMRAAASSLSGA